MTDNQKTIAEAWDALEGAGYPPEAAHDETGKPNLAVGISRALDCLIRQREALLREVVELRKIRQGKSSNVIPGPTYRGPTGTNARDHT